MLANAAVPRTRPSNGIFCDTAYLQITIQIQTCVLIRRKPEMVDELEFSILGFFGHRRRSRPRFAMLLSWTASIGASIAAVTAATQ
jgi:hypothetical protein